MIKIISTLFFLSITGLDFLTVLDNDQIDIEKTKGSLDEWEGT